MSNEECGDDCQMSGTCSRVNDFCRMTDEDANLCIDGIPDFQNGYALAHEDDKTVSEKLEGTPFEKHIEHDPVNHPSHYCREGGMESIDEMVEVFGIEAVMHFCICNVWKYRYRANEKGGVEDLAKSDFYMKKYRDLREQSHE